jgi:uncharacterized membrane protein YqiK
MEEVAAAPPVKIGTSLISIQNIAIVLIMAIIALFVYKKFLRPAPKVPKNSNSD